MAFVYTFGRKRIEKTCLYCSCMNSIEKVFFEKEGLIVQCSAKSRNHDCSSTITRPQEESK